MLEPTPEQCSENAILDVDGIKYLACWYPSTGGYSGKCLVRLLENGCTEAFIWHDGEFPFSGSSPVELHHCDADQFVRFGEIVKRHQSTQFTTSH